MITGPDGAIWFDGYYGGEHEGDAQSFIGRLGPDGSIKEFPLPMGREVNSPVSGPGGDIWFAANGTQDGDEGFRIGRISTGGQLHEYLLSQREAAVGPIAASGEKLWVGALLFNRRHEGARSVLYRVTTSPTVSVQQTLTFRRDCGVSAIAGQGDAVWFAELCEPRDPRHPHWRAHLVRVNATGQTARYALPKLSYVESLTIAPDGTLWFGSFGSNGLRTEFGRITPDGGLKGYRVPNGDPGTIAVGPEGRLWFPSTIGGRAYRALNSIDAEGHLGTPVCAGPKCGLAPIGLIARPDGDLWFSAAEAHRPNGGGGGSVLIEGIYRENLPGTIARLTP